MKTMSNPSHIYQTKVNQHAHMLASSRARYLQAAADDSHINMCLTPPGEVTLCQHVLHAAESVAVEL